jgi:hypothetical protein
VLAQHTLGYLFSARPQDRASYFKALLEVTDLEDFRNLVAGLDKNIAVPANPLIAKLELAAGIANAGRHLKPFSAEVPSPADLAVGLAACCAELVVTAGGTPPAEPDALFARVASLLAEKRAKTFALKGFERQALPSWSAPSDAQNDALERFIAERGKVDEETRRLAGLFHEVLTLPQIAAADANVDCPVCSTEGALTPARIDYIRTRVADTEAFKQAQKDAHHALTQMQALVRIATDGIQQSLPLSIRNHSRLRREQGFQIERVRALLGEEAKPQIDPWLASLRRLVRARTRALAIAARLAKVVADAVAKPESLNDASAIRAAFAALAGACGTFAEELAEYAPAENIVSTALRKVVDAKSETTGWQELIDLAADQINLRNALIDRAAHEQVAKELAQALKQIDKGNETVLEEKFTKLSDGVQKWWDLLRPEELSFFSGVRPRPGARRTIDFKAGLSAMPDRSAPKLRDVIAVFSQSQLHCLGLAFFLARSVKEKTGFIVLDDPILSSDEDYRAFFNSSVLEELLKLDMQVVVLTQDQRTWKDLGERYLHRNITLFQIVLQNPADGSSVTNTADDLEVALVRADKLIRGGHTDLHKQAGSVIRDAAERFCKEMLVRDRRAKGDCTASLNDYDNKNLGHLCPLVEPLLALDPSHPGKLRTLGGAVNPAKHDDAVPAAGILKVALGDLRFLKKSYL